MRGCIFYRKFGYDTVADREGSEITVDFETAKRGKMPDISARKR